MGKPALVVMAAGLGRRYGGLKQVEPAGPNGERIIDYSIYDALQAGFGRVIFVIAPDMEQVFRSTIGRQIESIVDTTYCFQHKDDLPPGFSAPAGREKPWGTGHAVLSGREVIDTNFAVVNADDFYGRQSFQVLHDHLVQTADQAGCGRYCMVGFQLERTLTDHGHVSRGVCEVDGQDYLLAIRERTHIRAFGNSAKYLDDDQWVALPPGRTVSMNMWGFTPSFMRELAQGFPRFLQANRDHLQDAEYYIPTVVDNLISAGKAQVKVLTSDECWYGITYPGDKAVVQQAIADLVQQGVYPENLWGDFV